MESIQNAFWAKYPAFSHVHPVADDGIIQAIKGVAPMIANKDGSDEIDACGLIGEKARIHTNGDMFVLIDNEWFRVQANTVRFIPRLATR